MVFFIIRVVPNNNTLYILIHLKDFPYESLKQPCTAARNLFSGKLFLRFSL